MGPGEYTPDPTEGITRVEDLPSPRVRHRSRDYRRRRCPRCGRPAYRYDRRPRTLHDLGEPQSGRPLDLRVVGSGVIDVPAGRFDCWKVEVREGKEAENPLALWVSKDRGWLVRGDQRGTDGRSETPLLSATPPAP